MITLGIIGVVAALTMPALISNHQKKVYVTQLKKSVNTLTNGFKLMLADAGVDSLEDTNLFINNGSSTLKTINANELKKYFNIVKLDDNFANYQLKSISGGIVYAHNVYGGSDSTKCIMLTFEDGTDACLIPNSNSEIAVSSLIDVNGTTDYLMFLEQMFLVHILTIMECCILIVIHQIMLQQHLIQAAILVHLNVV